MVYSVVHQQEETHNLCLHEFKPGKVTDVQDLGGTLTDSLTFKDHVNRSVSKVNKMTSFHVYLLTKS